MKADHHRVLVGPVLLAVFLILSASSCAYHWEAQDDVTRMSPKQRQEVRLTLRGFSQVLVRDFRVATDSVLATSWTEATPVAISLRDVRRIEIRKVNWPLTGALWGGSALAVVWAGFWLTR